MSEEIKEILDKLNKTADNPLFVICSSQKELDKIPKYTANFLSVNDRQAKLLLNYITNLQQKVDRLNNIIKIMENYLELIYDLGYDHDGLETTGDLMNLMDELVRYASLGRAYNITEPIYENSGKKYNILHEELKEDK